MPALSNFDIKQMMAKHSLIKMLEITASLVVPTVMAACGGASSQIQPTPTSDKFDDGYAPLFEKAPGEFSCPAQDMTYKLLSNANQVRAEGCGKQAIYVLAGYSGWVMNTMTKTDSEESAETGTTKVSE